MINIPEIDIDFLLDDIKKHDHQSGEMMVNLHLKDVRLLHDEILRLRDVIKWEQARNTANEIALNLGNNTRISSYF